jgi:hypothetical protein
VHNGHLFGSRHGVAIAIEGKHAADPSVAAARVGVEFAAAEETAAQNEHAPPYTP